MSRYPAVLHKLIFQPVAVGGPLDPWLWSAVNKIFGRWSVPISFSYTCPFKYILLNPLIPRKDGLQHRNLQLQNFIDYEIYSYSAAPYYHRSNSWVCLRLGETFALIVDTKSSMDLLVKILNLKGRRLSYLTNQHFAVFASLGRALCMFMCTPTSVLIICCRSRSWLRQNNTRLLQTHTLTHLHSHISTHINSKHK